MTRHTDRIGGGGKRSRSRSPGSRSRRSDSDRARDSSSSSRSHREHRSSKSDDKSSSSSKRKRSKTPERRRDGGAISSTRDLRSRSRSPNGSKDRRVRSSRTPDRHHHHHHHSSHRTAEKDHFRSSSSKSDRENSRSSRSSREAAGNTSSSAAASTDGPNRERVEDIIGRNVTYKNFDMDEQQKLLEKIMQERRERVEKWRQAQKSVMMDSREDKAEDKIAIAAESANQDSATNAKASAENGEETSGTGNINGTAVDQNKNEKKKKKWTLDDDDILDGEDDDDDDEDDDEEGGESAIPIDDDDDETGGTLMIPKRRDDAPDGDDEEDKIEKVVSSDKSKEMPSSSAGEVTNCTSGTSQAAVAMAGNESTKIAQSSVRESKQSQQQQKEPAQSMTISATNTQAKEKEEKEAEADDDIDPLDAYMAGIQEEVKKYRTTQTVSRTKEGGGSGSGNNRVTVVVGVAKRATAPKRGELMEQNQDGMEYSSGDEVSKEDELATAMDTLQAKTKQKKLQTISQDDITFMPFRKNFYIEVPAIRAMTNEEVEAMKTEMEGIKTKGRGCPRPIRTWAQCGVSKRVLEVLKRNNFEQPTPIQCQAIPAIMSGRDMIGIAKTGSGKTLAFLIPMFRHILDQRRLQPGDGPIAIIMTPTRELATQIYGQCRKFTKYLTHTDRESGIEGREARLRVVAVYGGTPISEQIGDLKPGAEIVVCTPGRMIDMLAANSGRVTNLRRCTYVVLDEADRMFDMGFEPQVMRIIDGIRPDRQTVMFSATFPRIMEALARRILDKPIEVQVGGRSVVCKEVEQNVVVIKEDDKFLKLLEILGKYSTQGSAITFVDKQEHADMLLKELMHAAYTCLALHGGIDQNDRDSTIADFKNGKVNVLVATSVAARGLDVKHCIVVINYDCPNHYEDYVHRCGRTGRAGNKGYAYTFITPEQGRYSTDLIKALEQSGNPIPDNLQQLFNKYKLEQEAQGKTVKSSSGFSGKGFKFDEAEAMQAVEKKRMQKAALGLNDSDDEDTPEAGDIDAEIESMLAPKKKTISNAGNGGPAAAATGSGATSSAPPTALSKSGAALLPTPILPAPLLPTPLLPTPINLRAKAINPNQRHLHPATTALGGSVGSIGALNESKSIAEKMEMAKALATKISMAKVPTSQLMNSSSSSSSSSSSGISGSAKLSATAQTEAILKGDAFSLGDIANAVNAKSIAEQRAERLNAKLNYTPRVDSSGDYDRDGGGADRSDAFDYDYNSFGGVGSVGGGNSGALGQPPISSLSSGSIQSQSSSASSSSSSQYQQRFEEELEINDFPQQARWRVTSKEAIASISEYSEAGITVRGTFFPPGKEPPAGERKLYLAIEGTSELTVSKARAEIIRLIKEELVKLSNNSYLSLNKGRYKVL